MRRSNPPGQIIRRRGRTPKPAFIRVKESLIQNQILSALKIMGIFVWKNQTVGIFDPTKRCYRRDNSVHRAVGISDILGIHHGKFVAIEVKTPTGKVTEDQKQFLERVKEHGGLSGVARSVEDAIKILEGR